jgi:hypothetical protein
VVAAAACGEVGGIGGVGCEHERDGTRASSVGGRGGVRSDFEVHQPGTPIDLKGWLNHELHREKIKLRGSPSQTNNSFKIYELFAN